MYTLKDFLDRDFEIKVLVIKREKGFRIERAIIYFTEDDIVHMRWLPLSTTFRLLLINTPDIHSKLSFFKREPATRREFLLKNSDVIKRLVEQNI